MSGLTLRLFADSFAPRAALARPLGAQSRALYVAAGALEVGDGGHASLAAGAAWFGAGALALAAGADGARALRFELVPTLQKDHGIAMGDGIRSALAMEEALPLPPDMPLLMRLEHVALPPGGIAHSHTVEGPGIRYLLDGALSLQAQGRIRVVAPGEAWSETGTEVVLAWAPPDQPAAFVRALILPRRLKGHPAVHPAHAEDRTKPTAERCTVLLDEAVEA